MTAYADTSCLVAVSFDEPAASSVRAEMETRRPLLAANLVEAELRSAWAREGVEPDATLLTWLTWIHPDRPLGPEMARALAAGYLRGADLWHVAVALYLVETPGEADFLTLDERQAEVAAALGFRTPLGACPSKGWAARRGLAPAQARSDDES